MIPLWFLAPAAVGPADLCEARQVGEITGLKCVGRFQHMGSIYQNPTHKRYDDTFSEYLLERGVRDTFEEYNVCRPTARREFKAVSRYGLPTREEPPSDHEQDRLLQWMELEFGPYVEGYRVLEAEEVDVQGGTTPGIPYKWYKRTKRETVKEYSTDIIVFWEYAHRIKQPVIWHNFVKEELLEQQKLDEDNARSITGPDVAYFICFSRMVQDFNHKLYEACLKTSSALGFNKFGGGLSRIAEKINRHPHKEEADMSKYDARQAVWIRKLVMLFRWRMMREEDKTLENWERLSYYYDQAINSYLALGLGYVLHAAHGMKSGDPNTTPDNTLIHFIVLALSYMRNVSSDYSHFKRNVEALLYGDDELISMSSEVVDRFCASERAPHYESCGVHFKVEQTVESLSLEGLTFLGNRFKRDGNGNWVGTPTNPRKTLASALKPLRKQTPGQSLVRAIALLCEGYWDSHVREILWGYVQWCLKRGIEPDTSAYDDDVQNDLMSFCGTLPTLRKIRMLWLGHQ